MIWEIEGKVKRKGPTWAILDVNGVGFKVIVPLTTSERLRVGKDFLLYTAMLIRDEKLELYGFSEERERDIFLSLIEIPGIGPRTVISLFSGITVEEFEHAVERGDSSLLSSVKGIGKKKAERIIFELKGKLEKPERGDELAVRALVSLGYKKKEAEEKIRKIRKEKPELGVEELVKEALKG